MIRPVATARASKAATAAHGQLQCRICCAWGQMGILPPPPPSRINPVWSNLSARAAQVPLMSGLPLVHGVDVHPSRQHIGIEKTGSDRWPLLATLKPLWLPRARIHPACGCPGPVSMSDLLLLGADEDSAPHPQQDPPSLRLPRAGFNVGSASSGGRWGFCPPPPPPAPSRINPV